MGVILGGGVPTTKLVTVTDAPVKLLATRDGNVDGRRTAATIQNVGTNTLYLGGANVAAGAGLTIFGVPDPQTTPPTQPKSFSNATTEQAIWGVCDTSMTTDVVIYEELLVGG